MSKLMWTLVRQAGTTIDDYRTYLLTDLAPRVAELVGNSGEVGDKQVFVTLQDPAEFVSGVVGPAATPIDAVLEIETEQPAYALDAVHHELGSGSLHVQGWRVHRTVIFDAVAPRPLLTPVPLPKVLCFVQRLDGTSPEHFSHNWYVHGDHLDGEDRPNAEAVDRRRRKEASEPGHMYAQNRVLEPLTATEWLIHGYTELVFPFYIPEVGDKNDRPDEEEPFERWPPRIVQGQEYRVV